MRAAMVFNTSGHLSGGVAKHLRKVTPLMLSDDRLDELLVMVPEGSIEGLPDDWPVRRWKVGGRAGDIELRARLREFAPDVVFIPSARWFDAGIGATLVMVRNMEPLEIPFTGNRLADKIKNAGRRFAAWRACRRADRIIAVSRHVRDHLVAAWALPASKIGVVYHGIDAGPPAVRPRSLNGLGDREFIFTAGSIRPARGLADLIRALADPALTDDPRALVIAGASDPGVAIYRTRLEALAGRLGVSERIVWAGQFGPAEMAWAFESCALFVTTSRAEACPNTVLEALVHGALSVSGDNAPMPEFFGTSALYYRLGDPADLARAICQALALPAGERERRREMSREIASRFSWNRTAHNTVTMLLETRDRRLADARQL